MQFLHSCFTTWGCGPSPSQPYDQNQLFLLSKTCNKAKHQCVATSPSLETYFRISPLSLSLSSLYYSFLDCEGKDNHIGNSNDQQVLAAYGGATCSDQNFEYDDRNNS
ncbi:hypothetical protein WN943_009573 [Citrus x changshan-huyou]